MDEATLVAWAAEVVVEAAAAGLGSVGRTVTAVLVVAAAAVRTIRMCILAAIAPALKGTIEVCAWPRVAKIIRRRRGVLKRLV